MLLPVGARGDAGHSRDGSWIGRPMRLDSGSFIQVRQPRSVLEQMVGKNEELLGASGGNLVYAGYPYDPFA
jgi:hypothetical protein